MRWYEDNFDIICSDGYRIRRSVSYGTRVRKGERKLITGRRYIYIRVIKDGEYINGFSSIRSARKYLRSLVSLDPER